MRIRVAGFIEIDGEILLMHRKNVKPTPNTTKPYGEYYVFPGGGKEESDKTLQETVEREILEELGIIVKAGNIIYERKVEGEFEEYVLKCQYISGEFGSGNGPEFSNDPEYIDRGDYIPEKINKKDIENIRLFPDEFKEKLLKDLKNNKI